MLHLSENGTYFKEAWLQSWLFQFAVRYFTDRENSFYIILTKINLS